MEKGISIKVLVAAIVIGGIILGVIISNAAKSFTNSMAGYYEPVSQETTYINSL